MKTQMIQLATILLSGSISWGISETLSPVIDESDAIKVESEHAAVISDSGELSPGARINLDKLSVVEVVSEEKTNAVALAPPVRFEATPQTIRATEIALVQHTHNGANGKTQVTNAKTPNAAPLSGTMTDQLNTLITANSKRGVTTGSCEPFDVMCLALAKGADAMVFQPNPQQDSKESKGSFVYSIGSLCWNYPCAGKTILRTDGQNVFARLGRGLQTKPSQFLSLLAMSSIMEDYELRVDGRQFTIAHLIKSERELCQRGQDMSLTLVGLSFYTSARESWDNAMGEKWSIETMVTEELNRPVDQGSSDATDWLLGLAAAVQLYEEEGTRKTGAILLAEKQVKAYHDFILSVQNEQGLWHPQFFMFRGVGGDLYDSLLTGGHIIRFLAFSLSDNDLKDPRLTTAIESLMAALSRVPATANAANMNDRQVEAVGVATQALAFYQQRTATR